MILKLSFLFGVLAVCSATADPVPLTPDPNAQAPSVQGTPESDLAPPVAVAPVPLVQTQTQDSVVAAAPAAAPAVALGAEVPAQPGSEPVAPGAVDSPVPAVGVGPSPGVTPLAEGPVIAEPAVSEPHTIIPPASPVVSDPTFVKLYPQEHSGGIYRTEKGEYVRLFKVLNLPPGLDGVPIPEAPITLNPGVPRPMVQRFVPIPLQLRSPLGPGPMMMGRSAGVGKTARYYDDYMYNNPYAYNQMYNPYYNGYANYPYSYAYNYNYSPYLI